MRGLLSVKWKLIIAVVGVSFICLSGMMLLNRHQAEQYTLDRQRALQMEASALNASLYNQAVENVSTIVGAISASVMSELEHASATNGTPDSSRIATFARSSLDQSNTFLSSVGLVTLPGVLPAGPENSRFTNAAGASVIIFDKVTGRVAMQEPDRSGRITEEPWWNHVARNHVFHIAEPRLNIHHAVSGRDEEHVECRFVQPLMMNGRFVGAVWANLCLTEYQRTLQRHNENRGNRESMLISPGGAVVGRPTGVDISGLIEPSNTDLSRLRSDVYQDVMQAVESGSELSAIYPMGGREVLVAVAAINRTYFEKPWAVMLFQPVDQVLADSESTLSRQLYEMIGMLLVSILLGYLVAQTMGRTLTDSEKWHRTILDRVPMPLGILDLQSQWIYVNPAFADLIADGNPQTLIGRTCQETLPGTDAQFILATNNPNAPEIESMEVRVSDNRIHRISSCRVLDTDGKYLGRMTVGVDVTDAKDISRTLALASSIAMSLDTKSERILTAAQSLSDTAMEQSAAIEEITSTTQKIGEASSDYAISARNSHAKAESTHSRSDKGADEALGAAAAMNGVRESGHKIRTIIKLIDDIAFQTNLLSLNAAVEAARAGRHGKGFAVVADEVRNLAGRSARAARETSTMIEEMTGRIQDATDSIEQLGGTLIDIKENAQDLRTDSDTVAKLADEQSQSVHQVHVSLEQISKSVDHTIIVSRETAAVAESIFQQAASLRRITQDITTDPNHQGESRQAPVIDLARYGDNPEPRRQRASLPPPREEK
ncbi:MAG: methyl-accepting chemotaxis protein [Planctomycetaceae bacterium]|nr:methyl-accepting chemotaxis protein [Planctomycetaceae bacterium]